MVPSPDVTVASDSSLSAVACTEGNRRRECGRRGVEDERGRGDPADRAQRQLHGFHAAIGDQNVLLLNG